MKEYFKGFMQDMILGIFISLMLAIYKFCGMFDMPWSLIFSPIWIMFAISTIIRIAFLIHDLICACGGTDNLIDDVISDYRTNKFEKANRKVIISYDNIIDADFEEIKEQVE